MSAQPPTPHIVRVTIQGIAPILQHRYSGVEEAIQSVKKKTGSEEAKHLLEWTKTMYADSSGIFIPSEWLERCLVQGATAFRIKGAGKKTYREAFVGGVFVSPNRIPVSRDGAILQAPDPQSPPYNQTDLPVYIDVRPVTVNRARVPRARLCINVGWSVAFEISAVDEQVSADVIRAVLEFGGQQKGIGDYRPRYGRFSVVSFTPNWVDGE